MQKQKMIDIHAKQYIQAVFEEQLIEEGFICPDDKLLCWYRASNKDIINSIIFYTPWAKFPLQMSIGVGIFPMFADPIRIQSAHYTKRPVEDDRWFEQSVIENYPISAMHYTCFSDEIWVNAPAHDGRGRYTLEEIILPRMDQLQTIDSVYEFHKHRRLDHPLSYLANSENRFGVLSRTFVDMALWVGDEEMYPYGTARAISAIKQYQALCNKFPKNQAYQQELAMWLQLNTVFNDQNRNVYLDVLSKRQDSNMQLLTSRYNMRVFG